MIKRMYHNDEGRMYAVIIPDKDAKLFGGGWTGYYDVSWGFDGVNLSFVNSNLPYDIMVSHLMKIYTIDISLDELKDSLAGQIEFLMEEIKKAERKE